MKSSVKYTKIFGKINNLAEDITWTTGVSNLVEHLLWDTKFILGISKTAFWKLIIKFLDKENIKDLSPSEKENELKKYLSSLIKKSDEDIDISNHYKSKPKSSYCSPNEALRRNKFFSEDYLNKEFDIFLNLCSDSYLDELYSPFINFKNGERWFTHGNSGIFSNSLDFGMMQMDNLAYNEGNKLLIANELKLGGHKNKDQILKYSYLHQELIKKKFIHPDTEFVLLFIGDVSQNLDFQKEILKEIEYVNKSMTTNKNKLINSKIIDNAKKIVIKEFTWIELIKFNEKYLKKLTISQQQVEMKLITGFNKSLKEKSFMQTIK